jgi:hypothetical protein
LDGFGAAWGVWDGLTLNPIYGPVFNYVLADIFPRGIETKTIFALKSQLSSMAHRTTEWAIPLGLLNARPGNTIYAHIFTSIYGNGGEVTVPVEGPYVEETAGISTTVEGPPFIEVDIDIRPWSPWNFINLKSWGKIPVAILSSENFDATTVDPGTVCFGDAEVPEERDCTVAYRRGFRYDINYDDRPDLILLFNIRETGIDYGDTQACLDGETLDGQSIQGCTEIRTYFPRRWWRWR